MIWLDLAGPLLLAVTLLMMPGLLVALAAGRRGFAAAALAPALSITAISVGAIAYDLAGVPWGWWTPLTMGVLLAGIAWGVRLVLARWIPPAEPDPAWRTQWPWWVASGLAAVLWLRHLRNVFDRPDAFSQTYDNIFHLSLVRFFALEGTGSSITEGGLHPGNGSWFYPSAFHDLASLTLLVFPESLPVAMTAAVWALVAVAWPLGVMYLVAQIAHPAPLTTVGIGVLTSAFTGFPLLLLEFGVLYPNMTGLILLPVGLALTIEAIGLGRSQKFDVRALLVGALVLPGMALSHPSALLSLLLVSAPLLVVRSFREATAIRRGEVRGLIGGFRISAMLVCLPVFARVWLVARPGETPWPPPITRTDAVGQVVVNAPLGAGPAWVVSGLVALGLVASFRRRQAWLVMAWGATVILWLYASSGPAGETRDLLVGVFYNDPYRLAALSTVLAVPLAAVGLDALTEKIRAVGTEFAPEAGRAIPVTIGLFVLVLLLALTQRVPYMDQSIDRASASYALTPDAPLLTPDELALILRVPLHVEPGAVVATNPWNGSSLLYAFTGISTTNKHVHFPTSNDLDLINRHLDDAATMMQVCPAARRLQVRYALDFGDREVHGAYHPFPGLEDLAHNPGVTELDREGEAALYRIDACG